MRKRSEAITPPDVLATLLAAASERAVLIGGQALGFWITHHHLALPAGIVAISNDADFLARSASDRGLVTTFAHVLHGKACFPPERSLTALVGQAVRELPNDEDLNVDVLFSVFGLDANAVWRRARTMGDGELTFQVMHPLDVLHSRLANLYKLREKQNDKGILQLRMSIDVAREYLREQAALRSVEVDEHGVRSLLQPLVTEIERLAIHDAGRKVAKRYGVHVADAIDPALIAAEAFWTKKWPTLQTLMSPEYAQRFTPPTAFISLTIDTSTQAFTDIGRNVELARLIECAAAHLSEAGDTAPLRLTDTNGNKVGELQRVAQSPPSDSTETAIFWVSLVADERASQRLRDIAAVLLESATQQHDVAAEVSLAGRLTDDPGPG